MKKFIAFFVNIWVFLFGKKVKETLTKKAEATKKTIAPISSGPSTPQHNNRKIRKGRFVQYINTGEGRQRAIYHSSKQSIMKNRKKTRQQLTEDRNALYHKVILRNQELGKKNTELGIALDYARVKCLAYEKKLNGKKWWQFWKWNIWKWFKTQKL